MTNAQPTPSTDTTQTETTADPGTEGQSLPQAQESAQAAPPAGQSMEALMAEHEAYEETFRSIKRGQLLKGKVVQINEDSVMVDIGYKTEGVIPLSQLTHRRDARPEDVVSVGEEIDVMVKKIDEGDGTLVLSKKRADLEAAWLRVVDAYENNKTLIATCTEQVKGGLIVDLGLRGFVPASHVDLRPVHDLSDYVGESLEMKVLEIDRNRRKIVLSRKKALEEERTKMKERTLDDLEEGEIVSGTVARLTNFGAFINLGGVDGLVHISELAWRRIKHPQDVVRVGEKVEVRVLSVNRDRERISLSLKQARPDPWMTIGDELKLNDIITGRVTKIAKNYAFVEVKEGVEGLVPVSELADYKIVKPTDVLKPDQEVKVKVLEIKPEARRILLSVRQAAPGGGGPSFSTVATSSSEGGTAGFTLADKMPAKFKHLMAQAESAPAVAPAPKPAPPAPAASVAPPAPAASVAPPAPAASVAPPAPAASVAAPAPVASVAPPAAEPAPEVASAPASAPAPEESSEAEVK
ncbi:MAG: 30S ribosomal protein S1 [Armatimonadetes bacterium]|nr:30S ribosomal protein S1 [Armatimonadota bacterium]